MMNFKKYVVINLSIALVICIYTALLGFNNITVKIHGLYSLQLDYYVKNYTIWAEWPVIVLGIFLMIRFNWRKGLWFSIVFGIESLFVQFLKFQSYHVQVMPLAILELVLVMLIINFY